MKTKLKISLLMLVFASLGISQTAGFLASGLYQFQRNVLTNPYTLTIGTYSTSVGLLSVETDRNHFYFNKPIGILGAVASFNTADLSLNTGLTSATAGVTRMTIKNSTGYVGIGFNNPNAPLQVKGDAIFGSTTNGARWKFLTRDLNNGDQFWILYDDANGNFNTPSGLGIQRATGNVSIGASMADPGFVNYKLSVNGGIRAKEIRVETGWADYVFNKEYKLMPLDSVKSFINENHHLPNVPSAKEVQANGVELGENQSVLLSKIEELTLYMIQLKEENEKLKARVESLEKEKK